MFTVYVIQSLKTGRYYTGQTSDINARLKAHNEGLSPYTNGRGPWKLVYSENFETRSEAIKREKFFKSGKGREYVQSKVKAG